MKKKTFGIDRRDFLKTAAVGASAAGFPVGDAVAAVGGEAGRRNSAANESAARGKPIRGIVKMYGDAKRSGIVVSNGLDCTLTDERGEWELPTYEGMRFVFVTVPSGFRASWHYLPYPGRNGPNSYTFWLTKYERSAVGKPCTFIQIADSETAGTEYDEPWKMRLKRLAEREDAAFIVHTGDICFRFGILGHFQTVNYGTMGLPVHYCLGNHDLEPGARGEEVFEAVNGPAWYSFDSRGVHFVITPMPSGDGKPSYTPDQVSEWIENDLRHVKKGTPVVFFNHMLCNWNEPKGSAGFTFGKNRRIRLDKLCNYSGFVYGHTHHNYMRRVGEGGKTVFVCTAPPNKGGICHDPESFRILTVEPSGRMSSRLSFGLDEEWKVSRAGAEWEAKMRSPVMFTAPLPDGDRLYVGLSDENAEGLGAVAALETSTGRTVWQADVPGSVFNRMVLAGGNVIAQTKSGEVYAFDAATGRAVWSFEGPQHQFLPVQSGLISDGERVYTGTPGMLAALDVKNGRVIWREKNPGYRIAEPCSDTPVVAEGVLVFPSNWGGLGAYDAATGKLLWRKPYTEDPVYRFPGATPVVRNGKLLYLGAKKLVELELRTGRKIRECNLNAGVNLITGILRTGHGLVFGTSDKGLMVVDEKAFKVVRTMPAGVSRTMYVPYVPSPRASCVGTAPVAVGGDLVAASATDGAVHVWNVASGKETAKFATGAPYLAGVAFDGKRIYAADMAGYVRSFKI